VGGIDSEFIVHLHFSPLIFRGFGQRSLDNIIIISVTPYEVYLVHFLPLILYHFSEHLSIFCFPQLFVFLCPNLCRLIHGYVAVDFVGGCTNFSGSIVD
jgi:hypothetical protein